MVPTSRVGPGSPPAAPAADVDAQVAAALARGDRDAALTTLMQVHGPELHRFCTTMLGDASLGEDVHQSVFVQAYEGLDSFRHRGTVRAWLFGIARHRCLDAAKARRRFNWRFLLAADAGTTHVDPAPAVLEQTSESDQRTAALRACLRALAPHVRVAVLLRYEQGLPYQEIADMSRERVGTIQARVARALPALRDCLTGKEATT